MVDSVISRSLNAEGSGLPACLLKLRAIFQSLPVHHARIAHFAMLNPADFLQLDARQIGYQCGTSEATVVRFCQRVGYKGLSEMKKILSLELAAAVMSVKTVDRANNKNGIPEHIFSDCILALKDTLACVDRVTLEQTATQIAACDSLYLFGAGGSADIAQEAALKFLNLGVRTIAFVDPIQQLAAARLVTSRDVALAVTYSGNQAEVARALQSATERRAFSVCITSFEESLISKSANRLLLISTPAETFRGQTGAHRVAQIAILDALAVRAAEIKASHIPTKKLPSKNRKRNSQ
jgi:DNA-binding MurR/RpiR family transcriptional regulator